ncbi:MAG TPA: AAA family ATPase [Syntrophales bacterium]|nr:AAA family ATPase [Syntrophales bacterium]
MIHPKLVEAMFRPEFYPNRPEHVEFIETHISYIFVAGDYVYKVKRPVRFDFLDFSTLEKRRIFCNEELRLNRRLAPSVYLDVVEIAEDEKGNIVLGGGSRIIDYAVLMLRLPEDRMLQALIQEGKTGPGVMDIVAKKLADFHAHAATGEGIDEIGGVDTVRRNHDENFEETEKYLNITIPDHQYTFIKYYAFDFMQRNHDLFVKRVADHRIRDCHGDLHLEHICIMDPGRRGLSSDDVIVFDCIEFNERFRYEDIASEVAFLAMDLDCREHPDYAEAFVSSYIGHSLDCEIGDLLNFYKCYYAFVRGKVTSFRLEENDTGEAERRQEISEASHYFDCAYTYAAIPEKPTLFLMAGLTGTGKSVRADSLAPRVAASVIRTDVVRKELLGIHLSERHPEAFGTGLYADDITRKTYGRALELAEEKLMGGTSVIIDATFGKRADREKAVEFAESLGVYVFLIECVCPPDTVRNRLELRMKDDKGVSDGRWEIYLRQRETYDSITEIPEGLHIVLDTTQTPEECTYRALMKIKGFSP